MSHDLVDMVLKGGPSVQAEKMVLIAIASFQNTKTGQCNPSVLGIADRASMSERGVRQVLRRLEATGWLSTEGGGGRHERSNYRINDRMLGKNPERGAGYSRKNPEPRSPFRDEKPGTGAQETRHLTAQNPAPGAPEPVKNQEKNLKGVTPLTPQEVFSGGAAPATIEAEIIQENMDARPIEARHNGGLDGELIDPRFFAAFWSVYPKRQGRKAARVAFDAAVDAGADPREIIRGARLYAQIRAEDPRDRETVERYTAMPAKWLSEERWADEPPAPPQAADSLRQTTRNTSIAMQIAEDVKRSLAAAGDFL